MPRYFFQFDDGQSVGDHTGHELPDEAAAREHATRIAMQLADRSALIRTAERSDVVTDETGKEVLSVHIPERGRATPSIG